MQIELYTNSGQALKNEIFNAVEEETLKTWIVKEDNDGNRYLTHKPQQYCDKAIFGFKIENAKLVIFLTWWEDQEPSADIKGIYMGRLTEMLLIYFSARFGKFEIIK